MNPKIQTAAVRCSNVALACETVTTSVTLAGADMREHAEDIRLLIAEADHMHRVRVALYGDLAENPAVLSADPVESIRERAASYKQMSDDLRRASDDLRKIEENDAGFKRLADRELVIIAAMPVWEKDVHETLADAVQRTVNKFQADLARTPADAELARLRKITAVTLGVGDDSGSLFVHGDYDSVKACQTRLLEADALRAQFATAEARVRELENTVQFFKDEANKAVQDFAEQGARLRAVTEAGVSVVKAGERVAMAGADFKDTHVRDFVAARDRFDAARSGDLSPVSLLDQAKHHVSELRRIEALSTGQTASPDQCAAVAYAMNHLAKPGDLPSAEQALTLKPTFAPMKFADTVRRYQDGDGEPFVFTDRTGHVHGEYRKGCVVSPAPESAVGAVKIVEAWFWVLQPGDLPPHPDTGWKAFDETRVRVAERLRILGTPPPSPAPETTSDKHARRLMTDELKWVLEQFEHQARWYGRAAIDAARDAGGTTKKNIMPPMPAGVEDTPENRARLQATCERRVGSSANLTEEHLADAIQRAYIVHGTSWRELAAEALAVLTAATPRTTFDLVAHLYRQRDFSQRTFGPGERTAANLAHIRKELAEIEANPHDTIEWIDVVLLAFDGAWRHGATPEHICATLAAKQAKNEARTWPDWRTVPEGEAINHIEAAPTMPPGRDNIPPTHPRRISKLALHASEHDLRMETEEVRRLVEKQRSDWAAQKI